MGREIRASRTAASRDVSELLSTVFVGMLLAPPPELWIISPWISNIAIIDNSPGTFSGLNPEWPAAPLRLIDLLVDLAGDTQVTIVVRKGEADQFLQTMSERLVGEGVTIFHLEDDDLHEKGIHSSDFSITGSMNLTFNGVHRHNEFVRFERHPNGNAGTLATFRDRYGAKRTAL